MKMTLLSRSREAKTQTRWRMLREEKRDSKSTCSSRESSGRHSSITCQGTGAAMKVAAYSASPRRCGPWGSEVLSRGDPLAGEKERKKRKTKGIGEKKAPRKLGKELYLVGMQVSHRQLRIFGWK
jgi:hypothetical protein